MRTCQLAALRKSFGKDLEFGKLHPRMIAGWWPSDRPCLECNTVFINAPHVLEPVDLTGHGITLDTLGASEASAAPEDPALKPRAWYKSDPTRTRADGLEESLAFLRDTLKTERFEVRHQRLKGHG
jgi:Serine hydrolase (FSH1)